jgi:hypothetical protein
MFQYINRLNFTFYLTSDWVLNDKVISAATYSKNVSANIEKYKEG